MAEQRTFDSKKAFNYMHGFQAMEYVNSRNPEKAMGALKALMQKQGASDAADHLISVVGSNFNSIKNAATLYQNDFMEQLSYANGKDLTEFYSTVLSDLSKKDKDKFETILGSAGKSIGEIQKELGKAEYILSGTEDFSDEQKQKAMETQAKYEKFNQINQSLLGFKVEETSQDAIKAAKKLSLETLAKSF